MNESRIKVEERSDRSALIVSPAGRLDSTGAAALEATVAAAAGRGASLLVLDCSAVAYISSAGLRALLVSAKACLQEGVAFVVARLQPECRRVVNASGLHSILDCRDTIEAALGVSPRHPPKPVVPQVAARFEINDRIVGSTLIVSPTGRLDSAGAPALMTRVSAAVDGGITRMVLDCAGISYVNSLGLRVLLTSAKVCQDKGGRLVIAALTPECRSVLEMSGFMLVLDCHETCAAAIAALT